MSTALDLNAALARALGGKPVYLIDVEPRARTEAETLEKAGARYWRADRDMLQRCWGPVRQGAQVAPHPEGESVDVPPGAIVCSARLP